MAAPPQANHETKALCVSTIAIYWSIFYNNILPTMLAAGAGYGLGRRLHPDVRSISRLAFYVFSPCLVFSSLSHSELDGAEIGAIAMVALGTIALIAALAGAGGVAARLPRAALTAFIVAAAFGNAGNFGLAVNRFAFGETVVTRAVVYYAFSTLAVYTLGVGVASAGKRSWRDIVLHGLTLPTTYALAAALVFRAAGWTAPAPVDRAIVLLGQGAIPVMLILLGMQLAAVEHWPRSRVALIGAATLLQLVVAPAIALGLAGVLDLEGPVRQAVVLEAGMPAAVISTILATEYDLDTALVSATVVVSTLLSPLTLTPLIAFLQQ
jgi:predicted permease